MKKSNNRHRRNIRPTYRVFCEGETEQAYIDFLRRHYRVNIQLVSYKLHQQINHKQIKSKRIGKTELPQDKDFMMYDGDVGHVVKQLKSIDNVTLLISTPCIELWFMLHLKNVTSQVDGNWCKTELTKRLSYKKGALNSKLQQTLLTKVSDACKRARKLDLYNNPSSSVYRLIDELEKQNQASQKPTPKPLL